MTKGLALTALNFNKAIYHESWKEGELVFKSKGKLFRIEQIPMQRFATHAHEDGWFATDNPKPRTGQMQIHSLYTTTDFKYEVGQSVRPSDKSSRIAVIYKTDGGYTVRLESGECIVIHSPDRVLYKPANQTNDNN